MNPAVAGWLAAACALAWWAPGRDRILCGFQWARYPAVGAHGPGLLVSLPRSAGLVIMAGVIVAGLIFGGLVVLRWLRFRPTDRVERAAVPLIIGIGITGTAWLGAGLAGLFTPVLLIALAAVPAVPGMRRRPSGSRRPGTAGPSFGISWWMVLPTVFLSLQCAPYWLCPETDQDALNFHLALPERFIALHKVHLDPLEAGAYAFRPMPFDLLHAPAVAWDLDPVARLLAAACLLAGLWLIGAFVTRRSGNVAGLTAALIAGSALTVASTAARAKNDLAAALAVTAAWLVWRERHTASRALSAVMLAGIAVAIKPTTAPLAAALVALIAASRLIRPGAVRIIAVLGMAGIVPILPWLIRTWLVTGDPAYPHLSPGWFPGLRWSAGSAEIWGVIGSLQSLRTTETGLAGAAWRWLTLDAPGLLALLPLAMASSRRPAAVPLAAVALAIAFTLAGQPAARYLIPATWVLAALLVPAVASLPWPRVALGGAVAVACLPHLLVFPAAGLAADDRARFANPWPYLLGRQDRAGFLDARLTTLREMRAAVQRLVPVNGRVLMHHDARGYRLGRIALRGQEDADEPVLRRWANESRTSVEFAKRFRQRRIAALTVAPARYFRFDAEAHPFGWDARMLAVWRDVAGRRLDFAWRSATEDVINGDYMILTVAPHDRPGDGPWPVLPGTQAAWSRAAYRMQAAARAAGGRPPKLPEVERELMAIRALLPGVGESALRLGHYHLATGEPAKAAGWYRTASAEGFESGQALARQAAALPAGAERDAVIRRGLARCGEAFPAMLADEARWRTAPRTMAR